MTTLTALLVLSLLDSTDNNQLKRTGPGEPDILYLKKNTQQVALKPIGPPPLCPQANAGADVTIDCGASGSSATIGTTNDINFHYSWYPITGLSSSTVYNPVASPGATTTYTLTMTPKTNMLVNGDFENGNTGFSSDYSYPLTSSTSVYTVGSSASGVHSWWCGTSPTSPNNMLIADGSIENEQRVWYQTIAVQPNSYYNFSGKFLNLFNTIGANDPNITVRINGSTIATQALSYANCGWQTVSGSWSSGSATSATIAIYGDPTMPNNGWGNDFAIDDLVLAPNCPETTDDVTVTIAPPVITTEAWHTDLVDRGKVTIQSNYDASICFTDIKWAYVKLISSQTHNLQWYKDNVPISAGSGGNDQIFVVGGGCFYYQSLDRRIQGIHWLRGVGYKDYYLHKYDDSGI